MNIFKDPRLNEKLRKKVNEKLKTEYKIPEINPAEKLTPEQKKKIIHAIRFRNNSKGFVDVEFVCRATKCSAEIVQAVLDEQGFRVEREDNLYK